MIQSKVALKHNIGLRIHENHELVTPLNRIISANFQVAHQRIKVSTFKSEANYSTNSTNSGTKNYRHIQIVLSKILYMIYIDLAPIIFHQGGAVCIDVDFWSEDPGIDLQVGHFKVTLKFSIMARYHFMIMIKD